MSLSIVAFCSYCSHGRRASLVSSACCLISIWMKSRAWAWLSRAYYANGGRNKDKFGQWIFNWEIAPEGCVMQLQLTFNFYCVDSCYLRSLSATSTETRLLFIDSHVNGSSVVLIYKFNHKDLSSEYRAICVLFMAVPPSFYFKWWHHCESRKCFYRKFVMRWKQITSHLFVWFYGMRWSEVPTR